MSTRQWNESTRFGPRRHDELLAVELNQDKSAFLRDLKALHKLKPSLRTTSSWQYVAAIDMNAAPEYTEAEKEPTNHPQSGALGIKGRHLGSLVWSRGRVPVGDRIVARVNRARRYRDSYHYPNYYCCALPPLHHNNPLPLRDPLNSFFRRDDIRKSYTELLIHDHRFTTGNRFAIDEYIEWLTRNLLKLYN